MIGFEYQLCLIRKKTGHSFLCFSVMRVFFSLVYWYVVGGEAQVCDLR